MGSTWGHIDIECLIYAQSIKMKFVVAFLACIVAAQAATFSCPSYEYWCAHSFHVLPASSYYCLTVPFDNCWIQSSFYKEVLVNFPKKTPFGLEKETKDLDAIDGEMERRFEESRNKIQKGVMEGLPAYKENLEKLHQYYIAHLKQYYSRCVDDEARVNEKVAEYTRELAQKVEKAVRDYQKAVEEAMSRIKNYHDQIIKQFREACVSRSTRVKAYCSAVEQRSTSYSQCYRDRLNQIVLKKVAFVKKVFTELYSDKVMHESFDEAIAEWEKIEGGSREVGLPVRRYRGDRHQEDERILQVRLRRLLVPGLLHRPKIESFYSYPVPRSPTHCLPYLWSQLLPSRLGRLRLQVTQNLLKGRTRM